MQDPGSVIVVGAGHGGLVAATHLASAGYHVTVLEKAERAKMGWDWEDDFMLDIFQKVGLPEPSASEWRRIPDITFHAPSMKTRLSTSLPEHERPVSMDRKLLINKLLDSATKAGATIEYSKEVVAPAIENGVVMGVRLADGEERHASLVVDSSGMDSKTRGSLPRETSIKPALETGEMFYVYRAYFNKENSGLAPPDRFNVFLGFDKMRGISWLRDLGEHIDILVGKITPLDIPSIDSILGKMRSLYPVIGRKVIRGGLFTRLPVRRPLGFFIANGYAATGDAACMTVPTIGSGIENAMHAGYILATVVKGAGVRATYSAKDLWSYQAGYIREVGAPCYSADLMKYFLMTMPWPDVEFMLEKRLVTEIELNASMTGRPFKLALPDALGRLFRGASRLDLLLQLNTLISNVNGISRVVASVPLVHEETAVKRWLHEVAKFFKPSIDRIPLVA